MAAEYSPFIALGFGTVITVHAGHGGVLDDNTRVRRAVLLLSAAVAANETHDEWLFGRV